MLCVIVLCVLLNPITLLRVMRLLVYFFLLLVEANDASSSAREAADSASISCSMEPVVDLDMRATSLVESAKISSASHALVSTLTAELMTVPAALNMFMVLFL